MVKWKWGGVIFIVHHQLFGKRGGGSLHFSSSLTRGPWGMVFQERVDRLSFPQTGGTLRCTPASLSTFTGNLEQCYYDDPSSNNISRPPYLLSVSLFG